MSVWDWLLSMRIMYQSSGGNGHTATVFVAREDVEYYQAIKQLGNPIIHCSVRDVPVNGGPTAWVCTHTGPHDSMSTIADACTGIQQRQRLRGTAIQYSID
jgi:hypothetical protein